MKRLIPVLVWAFVFVPLAKTESHVAVYFSPGSSCTAAIVHELASAKSTIHVQAYSFTSQWIAKALADAEKRGVKVVAILDASNRTKNYQRRISSRMKELKPTSIRSTPSLTTRSLLSTTPPSSLVRSTSRKQPMRRTPRIFS